ncbi:MAG TPA: SLC13 family permease [Terracidiphilus sp.]|nr:SLC13 family permease [Terracidiphilus sp.]
MPLAAVVAPHSVYLLACAAGAVVLLLILIAWVRLHPALGLAIAALTLGLASGMPLRQVPLSFSNGVGGLMAHIAIILGFGAILGQLVASSGGAAALGNSLVERCGEKGLPWALCGLGILVGMPVFFEVGLVLLMPIIAAAARSSKRPPILVGMPLLAGLSIVHGTLPPHPAAMLAATEYHADLGRTILWGLVVGIPTGAVAGPILGWFLMRRWKKRSAAGEAQYEETSLFEEPVDFPADEIVATLGGDAAAMASGPVQTRTRVDSSPVGPIRAASAILLPIGLIFLGSWSDSLAVPGSFANQVLRFIGSPDVALLIAVLIALITLGPHVHMGHDRTSRKRGMLRTLTAESFEPIANVLVIIAAAGGLSGVLRDSGAAQATVALALGAHIPPLVLAWLLAAVVRISMGSATVAMAVAAGVLAPMAGHLGVQPELLVLATGTGSLVFSQVNDPGFWMIQSFFRLEIKETFATWTLMETVLSVTGLIMTLIVSALSH